MNKNEKGFSLIEVIASIVIISIVLLSFFQLFIQSNKTAVANNEKLVVINLADAELERLKLDPFTETLPIPNSNSYNINKNKIVTLNNKTYSVNIKGTQNAGTNNTTSEKDLKLINVWITVTAPNGKTKSSVEGYVSYE